MLLPLFYMKIDLFKLDWQIVEKYPFTKTCRIRITDSWILDVGDLKKNSSKCIHSFAKSTLNRLFYKRTTKFCFIT